MANETKPVDAGGASQDDQASAQAVAAEKQVADLRNNLAAEQTAHQATKDELLALQAKLAVIDGNENALTEATDIIDGQRTQIAELEAQVIGLQTNPAEFPTFTVEKKQYQLRAQSFQYKGGTFTAKQLLADKALQKELVKKGVGFLTLVTEA